MTRWVWVFKRGWNTNEVYGCPSGNATKLGLDDTACWIGRLREDVPSAGSRDATRKRNYPVGENVEWSEGITEGEATLFVYMAKDDFNWSMIHLYNLRLMVYFCRHRVVFFANGGDFNGVSLAPNEGEDRLNEDRLDEYTQKYKLNSIDASPPGSLCPGAPNNKSNSTFSFTNGFTSNLTARTSETPFSAYQDSSFSLSA